MRSTLIAVTAAAVLASSSAWAVSRPGTAMRVCEDLAAYEAAEIQGAPF